jgi:hypothetical protein
MLAGTPAAELAGAAAELAGAAAELAGAAAEDGAAALVVAAGAAGVDDAAVDDDLLELHAVTTKDSAVKASTAEVLRFRAVMRIILIPSNVGTVPD